ncbi:unnamed protein product [Ectocarpus sp. CCAP 1310/34]|nr:unnamed protein product [Ectocarpus sp. CCAP 1310/34]
MASEDRPGTIQRQQSNWADEVKQRDNPTTRDDETAGTSGNAEGQSGAGELSDLIRMVSTIESQVGSLEEAMDPRGSLTELAGAYGRQVYESLGSMLGQARAATSEVAERVQTLSGQEDVEVPLEVRQRSDNLLERIKRAWLAHTARCPPQELERRLSREPSFSVPQPTPSSGSDPSSTAAVGAGTSPAGVPAVPTPSASPPPAGSPAGLGHTRRRQASGGSQEMVVGGRPLTRTVTLEDVINEADEREEVHRRQQQQRDAAESGGSRGFGDDGDDSAMPEARPANDERGTRGVADGEAFGGDHPEGGHSETLATITAATATEGQGSDGGTVASASPMEVEASATSAEAPQDQAAGEGGVGVFSFGRGDLGALLHADDADHSAEEGPVVVKNHRSLLQVSTSLFHTMAVTASGEILGCGQNDEGQVRPDLLTEAFLPRPSLVEPVLSHRITQARRLERWGQSWSSRRRASRVACGDLFTLILTSRAEVFSCGVGECVGGDGRDRKQAAPVPSLAGFPTVWMACGNSHSVVIGAGGDALGFGLNTHGQLGVGELEGGEGPAVLHPRPIVGTFSKPLTLPPAAVATPDDVPSPRDSNPTGAGSATPARPAPAGAEGATAAAAAAAPASRVGGDSANGGRMKSGATPPAFLAARAACGQSHTVLVSTAGEAWACGRNRSGQLGVDPDIVGETSTPVRVPLEGEGGGGGAAAVGAVQAAAGRAHSLVLLSDGRVVGFGSDEFGALGPAEPPVAAAAAAVGDSMEVDTATHRSCYHWKPTVIEALSGRWVASVSAGGEQSFAIAVGPAQPPAVGAGAGTAHPPPPLPSSPGDAASVVGGLGRPDEKAPVAAAMSVDGDSAAERKFTPAPAVAESEARREGGGEDADRGPGSLAGAAGAAGPLVRRGSEALSLRRRFSLPPTLRMWTVGEFLQLIRKAEAAAVTGNSSDVEGEASRGGAEEAAVLEAVRQTFASPSVLSACFNIEAPAEARHGNLGRTQTGEGRGQGTAFPRVDAAGLEAVYAGLAGLGPRVVDTLWSSIEEGMAAVREAQQSPLTSSKSRCSRPSSNPAVPGLEAAGASFLLKYWQGSTFSRDVGESPDTGKDMAMERICKTVLGLKGHARWWLMRSVKEDYSAELFSSRLVKPMVEHLSIWLKRVGQTRPYYPTAALLLKIPYEDFFSDYISNMPADKVVQDLLRWKDQEPLARMKRFFLCEHPFLISTDLKKVCDGVDLSGGKQNTVSTTSVTIISNNCNNCNNCNICNMSVGILILPIKSLHRHHSSSTTTTKADPSPIRTRITNMQFLLKAEAKVEQDKAAQASGHYVPLVGVVIRPFLVLTVNRTHLLQETLAQASKQAENVFGLSTPFRVPETLVYSLGEPIFADAVRPTNVNLSCVSRLPDADLRKKLKVVFRGEDGVDEGGVAKEFFQLLTVQLFDQSFGMFVPAGEGGRVLWFNKDCVWADEEYGLVGLLVGLAVYSGVILDVPLPLVVFKKLLGEQLSLEVTWDDLGMERSHDLVEGGANIPVTSENKESYVELYAQFLLVGAVSRQMDHFKQGFLRVMSGAASISLFSLLSCVSQPPPRSCFFSQSLVCFMPSFRAEELEVLVTGTSELDFEELAKATEYDGGYGEDHRTIRAFWRAVGEMPAEEQRRLLMFVTGSKKAPLGGLGKLTFKVTPDDLRVIQRAGPDTDHLPTAHTCFNTLMLPEYSGEEKLTRLLKRAVTECEGFGLR